MNPKVYKYFGVVIAIFFGIFIGWEIANIFLQQNQGFSGLWLFISALFSIVPALMIFLSGIYYYKFGKQNRKDNGLIKGALISHLIGFILSVLFILFMGLLSIAGDGLDVFGLAFILLFFSPIQITLVLLGSVLALVSYLRDRKEMK